MDSRFLEQNVCLDLLAAFLDEVSTASLAVVSRALEFEFGVIYVQNPFVPFDNPADYPEGT